MFMKSDWQNPELKMRFSCIWIYHPIELNSYYEGGKTNHSNRCSWMFSLYNREKIRGHLNTEYKSLLITQSLHLQEATVHQWEKRISRFLNGFGFEKSYVHHMVFTRVTCIEEFFSFFNISCILDWISSSFKVNSLWSSEQSSQYYDSLSFQGRHQPFVQQQVGQVQ